MSPLIKGPPWMTNYLKHKIHCKNSLYLKYLEHDVKGNEGVDM